MSESFGRFRLLGTLGEGGMGVVYAAELLGTGGFKREVALKVMRPSEPGRDELFLREGRALAALHHRNVVQVFELGEEQGRLYLAMERIKGVDLSQAIAARGRLDWGLAAYIAAEIANGLSAAHQVRAAETPEGFVHGDLSPSNVMLGADGSVKVLDFGLAKPQGEASSRTATGGKLAYLAPEIAGGRAKDALTDLYALGVCLYQMVEGRKPFESENDLELLNRILSGRFQPPSLEGAPRELLLRLMHADRKQRVATAAEAARLLEQAGAMRSGSTAVSELVAQIGRPQAEAPPIRTPSAPAPREVQTQVAAAPVPERPTTTGRRHRWALPLAAALGVTAVLGAAALVWTRAPDPVAPSSPPSAPPTQSAPTVAVVETGPAAEGSAALPPKGKLRVKFNRPVDVVWVDGKQAGRRLTVLTVDLPAGDHSVRARVKTEQLTRSATVNADETVEVTLAFTGRQGYSPAPKKAHDAADGEEAELVDPLAR